MAAQVAPSDETAALPPQDLHAEQATLGGMLVEPGATTRGLTAVNTADFYREAHRRIYTAIKTIYERSEPVDLVTVSACLRDQGLLDKAGGPAYLAALIHETPTAAHVVRYAKIVAEKASLRRLVSVAADLQGLAYSNPADVDEALHKAESMVAEVRKQKLGGSALQGEDIASLVAREGPDFLEEMEHPKGVTGPRLGIRSVDEDILGGFPTPGLVVVRAETSYGKTALLCQCARTTAQYGIPVAYFDLETTRGFVMRKMVQQKCGIDRHKARLVGADAKALGGAANALEELSKLPLHIEDPGQITFPELRGRIMELHREGRCGLYVIDFLQQISLPERGSAYDALSAITGSLQGLARDLNTTIAVASQVTMTERGWRTRGAPELQHRGDVVLTPRKKVPKPKRKDLDVMDEERAERESPLALMVVDKYRQGATGWRTVFWHAPSQLFLDLREVAHWVPNVDQYHNDFDPKEWAAIEAGKTEAPPPHWTGLDQE